MWCLINFANYEHIRELGAMARLTYAGFVVDPTFFSAQAWRLHTLSVSPWS